MRFTTAAFIVLFITTTLMATAGTSSTRGGNFISVSDIRLF
jgi:hypothetical protein